MENLFEDYMAARCTIKTLKRTIEEFKSGERYMKLQKDYHLVCAGYIKEIKKLRLEVGSLNAQIIDIRNMWSDDYYALYDELQAEIRQLKETVRRREDKIWEMEREHDDETSKLTMKYEDMLYERDCIINELENRLAHANALLAHDGTNTSLPTSQTPQGKNKRIPNTRTKTGRKKGGQPGHEKHALEEPEECAVTDIVEHASDEEGFLCPACGGDSFVPTGEYEVKYEYDIEVVVKKKKHVFYYYECLDCGTVFRSKYPAGLRGDVQYGSGVQAVILSLTNTVNAAMNKTAMFINGMTGGELSPCEGYVAKLQKRAARGLVKFRADLKKLLITRRIVYWDDTVIMILTKRGCFRFYGDETVAYYTAHEKKDMNGIDDDGVLELLAPETFVMHDHNTLNYNKKFHFENIECDQHLERDLQKNSDDTMHRWSSDIKKLIGKAIKDRDKETGEGKGSFSDPYIKEFNDKLNEYITAGWTENEKDSGTYAAADERKLLRRILKYRDNYFMWLKDFTLPATNNLSERSLRGIKSHMKISGQFESVEAADDHAAIRTYTETCRRNGINEIEALKRLCEGNPYTVQEIFAKSPPE